MFKLLKEMKGQNQIFILVGLVLILVAVFYPRENPLISAGISARLGNLGGKIQLEGMENNDKKTLVLFYADWCGHCKRLAPEWASLENSNDTDVQLVKINGDENKELMNKFEVDGFPTIYFLPRGLSNHTERVQYQGGRTVDELLKFLKMQ